MSHRLRRERHYQPGAHNHPLCEHTRALRTAAGLSLNDMQDKVGIAAARLRSWEAGARRPTVSDFDAYLRAAFGLRLAIVPESADVDGLLAEVRELRAFREQVVNGWRTRGDAACRAATTAQQNFVRTITDDARRNEVTPWTAPNWPNT